MADTVLDIQAAEVTLACTELNDTLEFFRDRIGFKLVAIFPSDDPQIAVLTGFGLSIRLDRNHEGEAGAIRLLSHDRNLIGTTLTAPNGTQITFADAEPKLHVPPPSKELVISKLNDPSRNANQWTTGRAGMAYRDLVPSRLGGHIIASHIAIPNAGPVADYVHYHKVHFQMIFCYKGSVKVLYEDNGGLLTINPGDCFLQPPEIRHRVMESSQGLEVIEVSCPSDHITFADNDMQLPNNRLDRDRNWQGQKFVHHIAENGTWAEWRIEGFKARDVEIKDATKGVADVNVVRPVSPPDKLTTSHTCPMLFSFILAGSLVLDGQKLEAGDSFVVPPDHPHTFAHFSDDLEWLEVALPADFETTVL